MQFADGGELTGTHRHLVWSVDREAWLPMQDFEPGDIVLADGEPMLVTANTILVANEPVYNLEILGEHVYEAGWSRVLVHNTDAACEAFLKEVDDLAKTGDSKGAAEIFWRRLGEFDRNNALSKEQMEALERLKKAFGPKAIGPDDVIPDGFSFDIENPKYRRFKSGNQVLEYAANGCQW